MAPAPATSQQEALLLWRCMTRGTAHWPRVRVWGVLAAGGGWCWQGCWGGPGGELYWQRAGPGFGIVAPAGKQHFCVLCPSLPSPVPPGSSPIQLPACSRLPADDDSFEGEAERDGGTGVPGRGGGGGGDSPLTRESLRQAVGDSHMRPVGSTGSLLGEGPPASVSSRGNSSWLWGFGGSAGGGGTAGDGMEDGSSVMSFGEAIMGEAVRRTAAAASTPVAAAASTGVAAAVMA